MEELLKTLAEGQSTLIKGQKQLIRAVSSLLDDVEKIRSELLLRRVLGANYQEANDEAEG